MLRKIDFIILTCLLVAGICLTAFIFMPHSKNGVYVQVKVNGKVTASLPLKENKSLSIQSADGGRNDLVIQNGVASIKYANCKDHICSSSEGISKIGQSIICLPHRVSIEITGTAEPSDNSSLPDAISR